MRTELTNATIIRFLKDKINGVGFVDSLKIKYRSLISPFIDLIEMVEHGEKVGDVGCGSGQFLLLLNKFANPSYLYGIEISNTLIDNANRLFCALPKDSYDFEKYDGNIFPPKLAEMDVIFLIDVFHHIPTKGRKKFIQDLIKLMKPGCRLIFKDIDAGNLLVYFNKLHDMIFAKEIGNEISFEKAKSLLSENGLQIIEQEKRTIYVYPHYTIVAKK